MSLLSASGNKFINFTANIPSPVDYTLIVNHCACKQYVDNIVKGKYWLEKGYRKKDIMDMYKKIKNIPQITMIVSDKHKNAITHMMSLKSQCEIINNISSISNQYPNILNMITQQIHNQNTIANTMNRYVAIITDIKKAIDDADTYYKLIMLEKDMKAIYHMSSSGHIAIHKQNTRNTFNFTNVKEAFVLLYMRYKNIKKPIISPDIILNYLQQDEMDKVNTIFDTIFTSFMLQTFYNYDTKYGSTKKWTPFLDTADINDNGSTIDRAYAYEILYDNAGLMKYILTSELTSNKIFFPDSNTTANLITTRNQEPLNMTDMLYNAAYQSAIGDEITINIPSERLIHILI